MEGCPYLNKASTGPSERLLGAPPARATVSPSREIWKVLTSPPGRVRGMRMRRVTREGRTFPGFVWTQVFKWSQGTEVSHTGQEAIMGCLGLVQKGLPRGANSSQPGETKSTSHSKGCRRGKKPTGTEMQDLLPRVSLTLFQPRECKASLGEAHSIKTPPHPDLSLDPALHPAGSGEEVLTPTPL